MQRSPLSPPSEPANFLSQFAAAEVSIGLYGSNDCTGVPCGHPSLRHSTSLSNGALGDTLHAAMCGAKHNLLARGFITPALGRRCTRSSRHWSPCERTTGLPAPGNGIVQGGLPKAHFFTTFVATTILANHVGPQRCTISCDLATKSPGWKASMLRIRYTRALSRTQAEESSHWQM
ncbi:hypothetical protein D3C72_1736870 [compost metagenome]